MKTSVKRIVVVVMALAMLWSVTGTAAALEPVCPTYQEAYESMIALKTTYPEGMPWTNYLPYGRDGDKGDAYYWKGGAIKGARSGVGCAAFAFILSDEAFGNLPARAIDSGNFTYEDIKVGDILRVYGNSHFVIVLQKSAGGVTVAEANYNKSVHWGRAMSEAEVMAADFVITRYPANFNPAPDADADKVVQQGTEGAVNWSLTGAGVLTISGDGAMPNFTTDRLPAWQAYNDQINTIVIESGVTAIGDYAFYQSQALSVYIPDSVVKIGDGAFSQAALIAVTVPGSVTTVGQQAFYMCPNLASVTIADGVKTIGDEAFRGCTTLGYIDFPASVTSIGSGAFMSCGQMTRVRFMPGEETVKMGDNLFTQCWHLQSVTLPLKADRISAGMFQSCTALRNIYIPAGVSEIGDKAFTQCQFLQADGIYFGGSEQRWNEIGGRAALNTLQPLQVPMHYDVVFEDPFAKNPDDPGDIVLDDSKEPTDPVDPVDPTPSDHDAVFADHDLSSFDTDGSCKHDGCDYTLTKFQEDCTADHSAIATTDTCEICGAAGTKNDEDSGDSGDAGDSGDTGNTGGSEGTGGTGGSGGSDGSDPSDPSGGSSGDSSESGTGSGSGSGSGTDSGSGSGDSSGSGSSGTGDSDSSGSGSGTGSGSGSSGSSGSSSGSSSSGNHGGSKPTTPQQPTTPERPDDKPNTGEPISEGKDFADMSSEDWAYDAVRFVTARGLFNGTSATTFSPNAPMTRAMVVTVLARYDGADTVGGETWYEKGAEWAVANGISDGIELNVSITREQLITMLWRYVGLPQTSADMSGFSDAGQTSSYAVEAMRWAIDKGVIRGYGNSMINPKGSVTRAEVAQIFQNFITIQATNA